MNAKKKNNNMRITGVLAVVILIAGIALGGLIFRSPAPDTDSQDHDEEVQNSNSEWTCSMHPQIRRDEPGQCPICAMDLIPVETMNNLDETADPGVVRMTESAMKLAEIQTTTVKRGIPEVNLHLKGKIAADERKIARITARFGGRFEKLAVNVTGQTVRKGDVLGTVYSPQLISAHKELLEAVKTKSSNPSFYNSTRKKLSLWNLTDKQIHSLEMQKEPVTEFEILSTHSGIVTRIYASEGDYFKEGSPLYDIVDLSQLWVLFDVYEKDLSWIQKGSMITFTVAGNPEKTFTGDVTFIDPVVNPKTRVFQVRVEVENKDLLLKPDMFAQGVLHAQAKETLLIPSSAVLWTGKRSIVYVKESGNDHPSFVMREIATGKEGNDYISVHQGLREGEEVVSHGVFRVDASAQLAGKPGMMNPKGGGAVPGHDHGEVSARDQSGNADRMEMTQSSMVQDSFRVSGLCGMCKDRIEKTAKELSGVMSAVWDAETQMLKIGYHPNEITLRTIHKAIAAVGHDTELEKAPDEVYKALPACCLYR